MKIGVLIADGCVCYGSWSLILFLELTSEHPQSTTQTPQNLRVHKSAKVSIVDAILFQHVRSGTRHFDHRNQHFDEQILYMFGGNLIHIRNVAL